MMPQEEEDSIVSEPGKVMAVGHGAVMAMAPGANLPAYVQAVSGIPLLSAERSRPLPKNFTLTAALTLRGS